MKQKKGLRVLKLGGTEWTSLCKVGKLKCLGVVEKPCVGTDGQQLRKALVGPGSRSDGLPLSSPPRTDPKPLHKCLAGGQRWLWVWTGMLLLMPEFWLCSSWLCSLHVSLSSLGLNMTISPAEEGQVLAFTLRCLSS